MRFGKGWEGKVRLNIGQENTGLQVRLASHTACLTAPSLVPDSFLGWPQPHTSYGICHILTRHGCCTTSIQHCHCLMPAPCPRQTLPPGRCRHSHNESVAELGINRNLLFFKSCYSNISEFINKLYIHSFGLLGKPQPKSIPRPGKLKDDYFQFLKHYSSFFNSYKSFS